MRWPSSAAALRTSSKSEQVLQRFGIAEDELALFRYRGYGNPGLNRIETKDGRAFQLTYRQLWEDEDKWMIQPRCKICPDAIGQVADIVASDAWLNGGPAVDDEALNGIYRAHQAWPRTVRRGGRSRRDGDQARDQLLPNSTSCNRIRRASAAPSGRG